MATSGLETSEAWDADILKCPICLETMKTPKSLFCLHSFCESCIGEYIVSISKEQPDGQKLTQFPCPVCRTATVPTDFDADLSTWASLLPLNFSMISMIERGKSATEQECHACKRREENAVGVVWCRDCSECLCQTCSKIHNSLKMSANHSVFDIEKASEDTSGVDVNAISATCPVHSTKIIEAFCYDHRTFCCVICLTLQHRKCDDVKAIDEMAKSDRGKCDFEALPTVLSKLKSSVHNLIEAKQNEKSKFMNSMKDHQETVTRSVSSMKEKLDDLLQSFLKELKLTEQEKKTNADTKITLLQKLEQNMNHWMRVTDTIKRKGSTIQQFIHFENLTTQVSAETVKVIQAFNDNFILQGSLVMSSWVKKIDAHNQVAKLEFCKVDDTTGQMMDLNKCLEAVQMSSVFMGYSPTFASFGVKLKKTMRFSGCKMNGGVSFSDNVVIVCDNILGNLLAINISTQSIQDKMKCGFTPQRIDIDRNKNMFVAGKNGFCKCTYKPDTGFDKIFKLIGQNFGGVSVVNDTVYVSTNNDLKFFKITDSIQSVSDMTQKFHSDSLCCCGGSTLHGLIVNPVSTNKLVFTSNTNALIFMTLEGQELFEKKGNMEFKEPVCLASNKRGLVLVGDKYNRVHLFSDDGKQSRILLVKADKIFGEILDVWINETEQSMFICGGNCIEIYNILHFT